MGGLLDAVDAARRRANVSPAEDLDVVEYGTPHGLLSSFGGEPGVLAAWLGVDAKGLAMPEGLSTLVRSLGLDPAAFSQVGLQARLPFDLQVR
jgi:protease-4